MTDGKPTFIGKCRQFYLTVQMLAKQFHNATLLPRCQTTFMLWNSFAKPAIPPDKV
jgi:hypothetical protein